MVGINGARTLRRATDGGHELLEPLDLGVEGPVVPDLVPDAERLEEARVHGRRADDGHVRALLEVRAALLRRIQQRESQLLGCGYENGKQSEVLCSVFWREKTGAAFEMKFSVRVARWAGRQSV
jgi:hypothetical protein